MLSLFVIFGGNRAEAQQIKPIDFTIIETDVIVLDSVRMQNDTVILNQQITLARNAVDYYTEKAAKYGDFNNSNQKLKFWTDRLKLVQEHKNSLLIIKNL